MNPSVQDHCAQNNDIIIIIMILFYLFTWAQLLEAWLALTSV